VIEVVHAGLAPDLLPYHEGWELQRRVHREVCAGSRPDTLLLCEHEAVYTAGKRTLPEERPTDGTPVVDVDRGGKITWHGPGQLTGYPIMRLPEPRDVVQFVRELESLMIDVVEAFGVDGERVEGRSGVWVLTDHGYDKIGAIGLRVQDGVTMHGFALNCTNSLDAFSAIVPCGIADAGVTTIERVTGMAVSPTEAAEVVVDRFETFVRHAGVEAVAA
jgi:lipoyl(octanoyl) transferase